MSIPALEAVRRQFPDAHITILARPWVSDVYRNAPFCDDIELYTPKPGMRDWSAKLALARRLQARKFDAALILPNSFDAALICRLAKIPVRIGYSRDGRGILLTHPVARPKEGEIPAHERYYYLELLRRVGWLDKLPEDGAPIHLPAFPLSFEDLGFEGDVIGVSPGAAFGTAKRWLPDRFAEAADSLAKKWQASVVIFGSKDERPAAEQVADGLRARGTPVRQRGDASGGGSGRADARGVRLNRRRDDGADRACHPHRPRAGRVLPLPQARMPDRPSLHDSRDG
jgi:heptosyltransferase-2